MPELTNQQYQSLKQQLDRIERWQERRFDDIESETRLIDNTCDCSLHSIEDTMRSLLTEFLNNDTGTDSDDDCCDECDD